MFNIKSNIISCIISLLFLYSCSEGETKKSFYPDGNLKREVVLEDGGNTMKEYYKSGGLLAIYELNDELNKDGKAILFFENGKKNGECLIYNQDGDVLKNVFFSNDSLIKESIK